MNKTTVIATVTAGLAGFSALPSAQAQTTPKADPPAATAPLAQPSAGQPPASQPPATPQTGSPTPATPNAPAVDPAVAPPTTAAPISAPPAAPPPKPIPPAGAMAPSAPKTIFPSPSVDSQRLREQGTEGPRASEGALAESGSNVRAEDWWSHARPVFEFHGYFRTRATLFHNFSLGRTEAPGQALYPGPGDNQYRTQTNGIFGTTPGPSVGPSLCKDTETDRPEVPGTPGGLRPCENKTQSGANMRFRLEPTLHVSDNLRINSQIDLLDNVVFGSTPEGYAFGPATEGAGYSVLGRSGYLSNGYLDDTQLPPTSGVNSLEDSIRVKRVWAEFTTPVGELRFGRMPNHWGLGMVANAGNGLDDDAQSTVDRIMFASTVQLLDLTIAGMVDFPNEGPSYGSPLAGSERYDRAQLDDVSQYGLMFMRTTSPELTKLALSRDEWVVNSGLYINYRSQLLANDQAGNTGANEPDVSAATLADSGFTRRGLSVWRPDLWVELLRDKLRIQVEAAAVYGSLESTSISANNGSDLDTAAQSSRKLRQYGLVFELQQKLAEDRLRLNFNAGWASGDGDTFDPATTGDLIPSGRERQVNDDVISTFRFHPSYRSDLILNRYILQRTQGTYFVSPSVDYDFSRQPNGQRLGGGLSATYTRAHYAVQTPGNNNDLGIELGGSLFYQSKDGALNDVPDAGGGFFGKLQYAVLFPLAGLGYSTATSIQEVKAAQALRLFLGAQF